MDRHHLLHRQRACAHEPHAGVYRRCPRDLSHACSSTRQGSAGRRTVGGRQSLSHCVRHSRSVSLCSGRLGGTGRFIACSRQLAPRSSKRTRLHSPIPAAWLIALLARAPDTEPSDTLFPLERKVFANHLPKLSAQLPVLSSLTRPRRFWIKAVLPSGFQLRGTSVSATYSAPKRETPSTSPHGSSSHCLSP